MKSCDFCAIESAKTMMPGRIDRAAAQTSHRWKACERHIWKLWHAAYWHRRRVEARRA